MSLTIAQPRFATARLSTGVQLRYTEHGTPDTEPIVCLHGYTDSSFSYSRVAPLLADLGYHVYALDQRGHGDSERPASGYAMDDFAADAVAFMAAFGIPRAHIIGHSMGSLIGRRVAALSPDRVAQLVLIGSFGSKGTEAARELLEPVRVLPDPVPEAFVREFQASTIHTPVPESFYERVVAESLKLPARVWLAALEGHFTANDGVDLGRIAAPTMLLWGEQDALIPREDQEELLAVIPNSRLIAYPETGHDPHWERPELVVEHLNAFLRGA
jgi:non-heme chloroperoxidase